MDYSILDRFPSDIKKDHLYKLLSLTKNIKIEHRENKYNRSEEFQVTFEHENAVLAVSVMFDDDLIIALAKNQPAVQNIPAKWFEDTEVTIKYLY